VVADNCVFELGREVVVHLGDGSEELHDNLDFFYFFSAFHFPVVGQTVLVAEDGLGVFGHHPSYDLPEDQLKVQLALQVLVVVSVPVQRQQLQHQLELEEQVNGSIIAAIDQSLDHCLHSLSPRVLQRGTGPPYRLQVHFKGQLHSGEVRLFLVEAPPVQQSTGNVQQIQEMGWSGRFWMGQRLLKECRCKLRLEKILLADPFDEPPVLKHLKKQVALRVDLV
jgi:hypothetical protein